MFNAIRRSLLVAALLGPALALARAPIAMEVWKTPSCGCCADWIEHVEANGFKVTIHTVEQTRSVRNNAGISDEYGSCHTAIVDGYAIEGHVPASDIQRLLREKPQAVGLSAPGMPVGSPGMDGPQYNNAAPPLRCAFDSQKRQSRGLSILSDPLRPDGFNSPHRSSGF